MANDVDLSPTPYGRWPDGTPITQLEASAKQMDDWAHRFDGKIFGAVKIGVGPQFGEPERSAVVRIGTAPPGIEISPPGILIVDNRAPDQMVISTIGPPALPLKLSWFRRFLNIFKGGI